MFKAIAPLSSPPRDYRFLEPYREQKSREFRTTLTANRKAFPSAYGNPKYGMLTKEINMIAKYPNVGDFLDSYECTWERFWEVVKSKKLPQIYVTCGTEENSYTKLLEFKQSTSDQGVREIMFDFIPGKGHNFLFWNDVIPKMLVFFEIN
jgi:hypothetical protein